MLIRRLEITDVRNVKHANIVDLSPISIFYGVNGSGKTTLLESIHILSSAKSFRSHKLKPLINNEAERCVVFAEVAVQGDEDLFHPIGVQRSRSGEGLIKINGENVRSAAQLAEALPLQVINSDTFLLLGGGPVVRRQFLDWGVFHVEHGFHEAWKGFQRCLKQRNSLLRHDRIDGPTLQVWTREYVKLSEQLDHYRAQYLRQFSPVFERCLAQLSNLSGIELRYQRGWAKDQTLEAALAAQSESEQQQGYTLSGPHRADLRILYQGQLAADILSRGQQKLIVCALRVAQGYLLSELNQRKCAYLVDDLPSELDEDHRKALCRLLDELDCQVFISCVDHQDLNGCWQQTDKVKLFHVEHGVVTAQT
ncbi:DNA replication/repair protein RecF [Dasania sp. GY-MA-18]|uniref:DNA replication and repair protein RecF n=1 Tax=Dasania phycosphaerae TaxID=2950436 RepID=A0A9J6RI99_9GAMM|nr:MULTISPECIES: DNA replication/repair protein RecF [Dasania]MCR8921986.1 DNA replication/repair protein RecF [Dasania sp. GY-MA-18]MCZ0864414.1 DNA replication/repair protein RecF [Dasania phycosphaerae]MCZ0868142.1 DNA replication/repair protein RecF [Dasania phycosphaerae]